MMEISDIFNYFTFRNVLFGIFSIPLVTMLVLLPFAQYLSKNAKELIAGFSHLGMAVSLFCAVVNFGLTIGEIYFYLIQKPLYFDSTKYESFDFVPLVYLIVLAVIAILSGILADYYYGKKKGRRILRRKKSDVTSLNLSE
jgi:hypothetical protein